MPSLQPHFESSPNIDPIIYDKLLQSEQQLTNYLKYLRYKQPIPKLQLPTLVKPAFLSSPSSFYHSHHHKNSSSSPPLLLKKSKSKGHLSSSQFCSQNIKPYIKHYFTLMKQVYSLENSISKKIIKKTITFLEQFPSLQGILIQTINSFGKQKKKLCLNEEKILVQINDDMIPLIEKIIEKVEGFKREAESKKLMELGHRIEHLQVLIDSTKDKVKKNDQNHKIFRTLQPDRIEKYLVMEDNINKAEKDYGNFSQNFVKNRQVFSNINKVYLQIRNSSLGD